MRKKNSCLSLSNSLYRPQPSQKSLSRQTLKGRNTCDISAFQALTLCLSQPRGDAVASLALAPGCHICAPSALYFDVVQSRSHVVDYKELFV
jgi:hypothetical protein